VGQVADELRAFAREFYLPGTPEGRALEPIIERVEALECAPPPPPEDRTS
jgi:hypothetical protein